MAEKLPHEEKQFPVPALPLEVRLSIDRGWPPALRVVVHTPKCRDAKGSPYARTIGNLFHELKGCITASGLFPQQGRLLVDPYATDDLSMDVRYPSHPALRYPVSLMDRIIRNPIEQSQRHKKYKANSEKLFALLNEQMPVFLRGLANVAENERLSHERNAQDRHVQEKNIDKELQEALDLLGVSPGTPWEKIKKSYHDHARKAHPDAKNGMDDGSFHKLQQAFEIIKARHQENGK